MLFINYNDSRDAERIKAANRKCNILYHPLGELSVSDFYMTAFGDQSEQHRRLTGMQIEIIVITFLTYIFARNLIMTSNMLISRSHTLPL
jgi:hypothetical protein